MSGKELLDILFKRYDTKDVPTAMDPKEWEQLLKSIRIKYFPSSLAPSRLTMRIIVLFLTRIAKILRLWLQNHFIDFVNDPQLLDLLGQNVKRTYGANTEFSYLASEIIELVNVQQKVRLLPM